MAMLHLHLHEKRNNQIVDSRRKSGLRPAFPNQTVNQGTDEGAAPLCLCWGQLPVSAVWLQVCSSVQSSAECTAKQEISAEQCQCQQRTSPWSRAISCRSRSASTLSPLVSPVTSCTRPPTSESPRHCPGAPAPAAACPRPPVTASAPCPRSPLCPRPVVSRAGG